MILELRKGCVLLCLLLVGSADGQKVQTWVGSWASAQQIPEASNALAVEDLRDATIRQVVHLSVGGARLRVHLSNVFGTSPLHVSSVHVARPVANSAGVIEGATDRVVTFAGKSKETIPPGAEYFSDAVEFPAAALSDVAITLHVDAVTGQQTGHPGSRATSYLVHGDAVSATSLEHAKTFDHWTMLSAVDVDANKGAFAVVALGDSITDGHGTTVNGNDRWPDVLAQRLQGAKAMRGVGVLNEGIGGNHLLTDGLGPNVLARFDRDVLAPAGVQTVLLLEGVNDLGALAREPNTTAEQHELLVASMEAAYTQIVERAHTHGIKVIGGTIMPYVGSDYYHPGKENEADRQAVNAWIRAAGHFDAIVDFDRVMADPQHLDRLLPMYDCGDHLHPSVAGYRVMAEAIPLNVLSR